MFALRGESGDGCAGRNAKGGLDDGAWKGDVASMVCGGGSDAGGIEGLRVRMEGVTMTRAAKDATLMWGSEAGSAFVPQARQH